MDLMVACDSSERPRGEDPHLQSVHPVKRGTAHTRIHNDRSRRTAQTADIPLCPATRAGGWEIVGRISD